MAFVPLGLRLVLATVFAAAALTKLRDRKTFEATFVAFGGPAWAAVPATIATGLLEVTAAVLLVPTRSAPVGAALAGVLLVVFSIAALLALARGHTPDCSCFGGLAREPIGVHTLVRNGLLLLVTLLVVDEFFMGAGLLVFVVAAMLLSFDGSRLRTDNRRLVSRVAVLEAQVRARPATESRHDDSPGIEAAGLPQGTPAPAFDLPRLEGDRASLGTLSRDRRDVALVFLSAHCSTCHELWPDLVRWQSHAADTLTVAAICSGSDQTIELKVMGYTVTNVLLEGSSAVGEAYGVPLRPAAVIVADGAVDSPTVVGLAGVRALIDERIRHGRQF